MDYSYLSVSDGTGEAVIANIESDRAIASVTIDVDSVDNFPTNFIAASGTKLASNYIDPATMTVFYGHVDSGDIIIDGFAPGYVDDGNTTGQIVVIKPNTYWADEIVEMAKVVHNDDGTLKDDAVTTDVIEDDAVTAEKIDWAATGADGGIWWEELGRNTLGVAGDTLSVTPIAARKYLRILISIIPTGGNTTQQIRFNNDSSGNYAIRVSTDYAAATTAVNQTSILPRGADSVPSFLVLDVINITAQEKEVIATVNSQGTAGAGNLPSSTTAFAKWVNTAQQITRVDVVNGGTGDFAIGSEIIVLGHN